MRRSLLVLSCVLACAKDGPATAPAGGAAAPSPVATRELEKAEPAAPAPARAAGEGASSVAPVDAAPTTNDAPVELDVGGDLASLEAELDALETRLREEGVRLHGYKRRDTRGLPRRDDASKPGSTPAPRCETRCDLAEAVCGLEAKICTMAKAHASEPKYGAACRRAERDCERATVACDECGG